MVSAYLDELVEVLVSDPGGLRAAQLMEQALRASLDLLGRFTEESDLLQVSQQSDRLVGLVYASVERTPEIWRVWYGGQLQAVSSLMKAHAARELPSKTLALLREHSHARPILEALFQKDCNISDLASALGVEDLSQMLREVRKLRDHGLVDTVKAGRERWVRLTGQGYRALAKVRQDRSGETPGSEEAVDEFPADEGIGPGGAGYSSIFLLNASLTLRNGLIPRLGQDLSPVH